MSEIEGTQTDAMASWNPAFRPDEETYLRNHEPQSNSSQEGQDVQLETHIDDFGPDASSNADLEPTQESVSQSEPEPTPQEIASDSIPVQNTTDGDEDFFANLGQSIEEQSVAQAKVAESQQLQTHDVSLAKAQSATPLHLDEASELEFGAHFTERLDDSRSEENKISDVDPALRIHRAETHTFDELHQISRSPSFPPISEPQHLPHTQAETILALEDTDEPESNREQKPATKSPWDDHDDIQAPFWAEDEAPLLPDEDETSFFDKANQQSSATQEPSDAEARFEEGVPLVPDHGQYEGLDDFAQVRPSTMDQLFSSEGDASDIPFFSQTAAENATERTRSSTLERKDTSDVLSSMQFETHGSHPERRVDPERASQEVPGVSNGVPERGVTVSTSGGQDLDDMWKAALQDDDFLIDDDDGLLSDEEDKSSFPEQKDGNQDVQKSVQQIVNGQRPAATQSASATYIPHQPSTSEMTQPFGASQWGGSVGGQSGGSFAASSRPQIPSKAESFVAQNKGGYKSPYDLPMDLTSRPRKRPQAQPSTQNLRSPPVAPPRSSSMTLGPPSGDLSQAPAALQNQQGQPGSIPSPSAGSSAPSSRVASNVQPPLNSKASSSSFFEELPVMAKPRPPTAQGRYTPMQPSTVQTPPLMGGSRNVSAASVQFQPSHPQFLGSASQDMPPPAPRPNPHAQYELQKPERQDPYANLTPQSAAPNAPALSRYSPAPVTAQPGPRISPSARYSPAPPPQQAGRPSANRYVSQAPQPTPPSVLPFQPRTSSPLAYHEKPAPPLPPATPPTVSSNSPVTSPPSKHGSYPSYSQQVEAQRRSQPLSTSAVLASLGKAPTLPLQPMRTASQYLPQQASSLEPSQHDLLSQPRRTSETVLMERQMSTDRELPAAPGVPFAPPRRSQTQSPRQIDTSSLTSPVKAPVMRPASVQGQGFGGASALAYSTQMELPRQRAPSLSQNFIAPTDGSQFDELQRWRGCPIFHFTPGGSIVSHFTKHVPRYTPGQVLPLIKPTPGLTRVRNAKEVLNVDQQAARFPGPLRSKSKKKDVLTWISERIGLLEQGRGQQISDGHLPDPNICHDEKILLWKTTKILVENDGNIEGKPDAQKAITDLLADDGNARQMNGVQFGSIPEPTGIYRANGTYVPPDPVDPAAVEKIRQNLLHGDREKAVWDAVDRRLWAHALLISSTLDKKVWKQVVHEFVRQEVKSIGENTESLAAVYQVFGGNLEDSIDELVPPSARAGLQMVSKITSNGPTKNALEGLNKWKETLGLIINNHSSEDYQAISSLGRLLSTYGRIEAAHICFLLARAPPASIFGGVDEPHASVVLLGANHHQKSFEIAHDEDAIMLTEVYEFATSVLAGNAAASATIPHLQPYKLQRAVMLSETGFKNEALQYCEAISGSLKSTTRISPYFHSLFVNELDELANRLRQAPVDGSSSWKPSIDKVSGGLLSKFNSFVTGGDEDAGHVAPGKDSHEFGPFANVNGTPSMSREASQVDLYSTFANAAPPPPTTTAPPSSAGRYAPGNQYAPRSSGELLRGRPSLEGSRSLSYAAAPSLSAGQPAQRSPSYEPPRSRGENSSDGKPALGSPYLPLQSPTQSLYQPTPPDSSHGPKSGQFSLYQTKSYEPTSSTGSPYQPESTREQSSYIPSVSLDEPPKSYPDSFDQSSESIPAFGGYEPPSTTFQPPQPSQPEAETNGSHTNDDGYSSYGGYAPPSYDAGYVPYQPDPTSDGEDEKIKSSPKKKSVMDLDDDDMFEKSAPPKPVNKDLDRARKDADADAAFRAAAEADAKRGNEQRTLQKKGSWFGTWFAKGEAGLDKGKDAANQKVYKAKLGEESSFYYDKDLKKWVNKKDPGSATASAKSTPPPPKGMSPMPRSVSGLGGPPMTPGGTPPPTGPPRTGMANSSSLPNISNTSSRPASPADSNSPAGSGLAPPSAMQRSLSSGPPSAVTTPPIGGPSSAPPAGGPPKPANKAAADIDDLLGGPPMPRKSGTGTARAAKKKGRGYVDVMAQK